MKQASLKLKMSIQNVNIIDNNIEVQKIILRTMLLIIATLAIFYVLILGNMVFNITQRKVLEKEALVLSSEVGNLELSYLSISNKVDLTLSSSMGFKETRASFATRKSLSSIGSLSSNNNEI
ncbi:MAG: hypothetical protein WCP17_00435 [bacterium]